MEKILKYFPNITPEQKRQLEMLGPLYEDWNAEDQRHLAQGHQQPL